MENQRKPTRGLLRIGELFICDCGIPLARKTGHSSYEVFKEYHGQKVKIEIDIESGSVRCVVCKRGPSHIKVPVAIPAFDFERTPTTAGFGLMSTTAAGMRFASTCAGGV